MNTPYKLLLWKFLPFLFLAIFNFYALATIRNGYYIIHLHRTFFNLTDLESSELFPSEVEISGRLRYFYFDRLGPIRY